MWVDICRDMDVIMHGDIKAESYYRDMACILKKQQEMQDPLPFGMTFVKKNTLIYRMNVVTKYFEKERKNSPAQGIAVILLFCMLFAAAIGSGEFMFRKSFLYLYGLTRTSVVEQYTYTASAEYCEERSSVKAEIMEGEALNNDSLQFTFGWKRGKRLESQEIYLEQGQAISFIGDACGASDEDKHRYIECKYGYTDQTSDYFCVGEGSLLHTFYVQESGYYRFFAENLSDSNEGIELEMTVTIINSK